MKLDKRTERRIISEVQDAYEMRDEISRFMHTVKFDTFHVVIDKCDHELYAIVIRLSDGQIFENISNYIEEKILDKYIKLD